ncbi:MAG: TatD family hydrolase [Planctomycetota bacterium]
MGDVYELVDSHTHLDDAVFGDDLGPLLARASDAGVRAIVTIGTTASSSAAAVSIASRWSQVYAAVGIQPNHGSESTAGDWTRIVELAKGCEVRAIGETGLDAHWDFTPMGVQRELFEKHIRLSQELDLPVVVHMRDCAEETIAVLRAARQRGPLRGVMHSFTGDARAAHQCLELGLFISFAGMVTFKNSNQLREIACHIPADRILIETDSPYLTPHPHRGERPNEPEKLPHTARCLAQARGEPLQEFAADTTANARRLFGLE